MSGTEQLRGFVKLSGHRPLFQPPEKYRSRDRIHAELRNVIRKVIGADKPWPLFMCGEAGSGKSCAALCMVDVFGDWYVTLAELCEMLLLSMRDQLVWSSGAKRSTADVWQDWSRAHLAVLDEIGARSNVSDFHYESLKRAIDIREGKPAVFISNHDPAEIAVTYDDRIASRLASGSVVEVVGDRRIGAEPLVIGR
ncbi:MAG: hypothetical protein WBE26_06175 [Phycisphaerae bacterium]